MSRAFNILTGAALVFLVWAWMLESVEPAEISNWYGAFLLVAKVSCACFITGPIYREYLR